MIFLDDWILVGMKFSLYGIKNLHFNEKVVLFRSKALIQLFIPLIYKVDESLEISIDSRPLGSFVCQTISPLLGLNALMK